MRATRLWFGIIVLVLTVATLLVSLRSHPTHAAGPQYVAQATSITVNTTTDELNSDGDCSLREAIQAANTDTAVDACQAGSGADTISLPAGSYTLTLTGANENANATGDLDITANLTIIGAGAASTVINANRIDRALHTLGSTTLNLQDITIQNGNSGVGGGAYFAGPATLTGTTFISNTADNGGPMGDGGGVYFASTAIMRGTTFISNTASGFGGGAYFAGPATMANTTFNGTTSVYGSGAYFAGPATLTDTTFTSNGGWGGALFQSTATLTGTTFISNTAYNNGGGATFASTATLTNTTFTGNTAVGSGGGGARFVGPATLVGTTFISNTVTGILNYGGGGGALFQSTAMLRGVSFISNTVAQSNGVSNGGGAYFDSTVMLTDTTFTGNTASYGGGAYFRPGAGQSTLADTTFISNAAAWGGGIFNWGTLTVTNSSFSSNSAGASGGGGISIYDGNVTLNNSTVSGNQSDGYGGGISNNNTGMVTLNSSTVSNNVAGTRGGGLFGSFTLRNTIAAGNSATSSGPDCSFGPITSAGYNLIGNTSGCTFTPGIQDLTNINAKLSPLVGSPGYHPLLSGSPAIDAGNPSGCLDNLGNLLTTDQRGLTRFGRCDIGAYEEQFIKSADPMWVQRGNTFTYTLGLHNGTTSPVLMALTDTLPITPTYLTNSLTVSSGSYVYQNGIITWTGTLNPDTAVTITLRAVITSGTPLGSFFNVMTINDGSMIHTRQSVVRVSTHTFLPVVLR